jgi:thiol-disulfide isomerase/thioredoxin
VQRPTSKTFERAIAKSTQNVWLVEFYSPSCGHCQQFESEFESVAESIAGFAKTAAVNVARDEELAQRYSVRSYPTFLLFAPSLDEPVVFEGQRSAKALKSFVATQMPSKVAGVRDQTLHRYFATQHSRPHALLFSSKSKIPAILKALSLRFPQVHFGFVVKEHTLRGFEDAVQTFPTLIMIEPALSDEQGIGGGKRTVYDGELTLKALAKFVAPFAGRKYENALDPAAIVPQFSVTSASTLCAPHGGKLCAVALHDGAALPSARKQALLALQQRHEKDHIRVMWGNTQTLSAQWRALFAPSADVHMLVINPKRNKFAIFEKEDAAALESVVSGGASWNRDSRILKLDWEVEPSDEAKGEEQASNEDIKKDEL